MKFFSLVSGLILFSHCVAAQVTEGNKFINGTVRLLVLGNSEDTQTAFTLTPTFGYLISDQMALGGTLGVVVQPTGGNDNDLTIFLSPFVRYYFPIADDQFYFFLDGTLSLSFGNSAAGFGEFRSSEDAFSVGLAASPGFAYFPAERWSLDFTFTGFGLNFFDVGGEDGTTTLFTIGATSFSPSLGFSYFF